MLRYERLATGQTVEEGTELALLYGALDSRRVVETFQAPRDWKTPETNEGFWYGRYLGSDTEY